MIRHILLSAALVTVGSVAAIAQAEQCYHNGRAYDDGERVGETVCRDGTWVEE